MWDFFEPMRICFPFLLRFPLSKKENGEVACKLLLYSMQHEMIKSTHEGQCAGGCTRVSRLRVLRLLIVLRYACVLISVEFLQLAENKISSVERFGLGIALIRHWF